MADDRVSAELAAIRAATDAATEGPWEPVTDDHGSKGIEHAVWAPAAERYAAEFMFWKPDAAFVAVARTSMPRLLAAVEAALKAHPPVPVYEDAWHGHVPTPAGGGFALHCGHPGTALEDDRHAESDEGDWICLDQLIYTACGGCRDDEGEPANLADCATRAAIERELTRKDGPQ